jgi:NAD(P)-dependent dehydrogenase (short-subunit alcohol dehydrogenase family)
VEIVFASMEGTVGRRIAVVTGATSGIGLETARGLAREGWNLVLACRDMGKAEAVRAALTADHPRISVESLQLDLASLDSIRAFATELAGQRESVNLLVNNAGVFCDTGRSTLEGFEMTIGVNFLGTFLLTRLILPLLLRAGGAAGSQPARIVNVASAAAAYGRLRLGAGVFERGPHGFRGYAASKLAVVLFTLDLAEELAGRRVTANAVHPGEVATNIWRGESLLMKIVAPIMQRRLRSPAEGARAVLHAATASNLEGITGRFLDESGDMAGSPKYLDGGLRKDLMRRAATAVGLSVP